MSIDVGPLFALGQALAESAITTSGTTVTVTRGAGPSAVDPDTLAATTPAGATVYAGIPAIVVPDGGGVTATPYPPAPRKDGGSRVLLKAAAVNVRVGDTVAVTASRDARLVGRRFLVTDVPDSSAGAVRSLAVKNQPQAGLP